LHILHLSIYGVVVFTKVCSTTNNLHTYVGAEQINELVESYQAEDYPAIKWEGLGIITPNQLNSVLKAKNIATLGVREYLTGGKYKYIYEITEGYERVVLIHRIFQYREYESLWLFRDLDQDGIRFKNYILVTSWTRDNGGCHHIIFKKGKTFSSVYRYV